MSASDKKRDPKKNHKDMYDADADQPVVLYEEKDIDSEGQDDQAEDERKNRKKEEDHKEGRTHEEDQD